MAYGDYGVNYKDDPEYKTLNSQFRALFGSSNFGDFDYDYYNSDPNARDITWSTATQGSNQPQKQQALQALLGYFKGSDFKKIDPKPYFDPLRGEIDKQAGQSLQNQYMAINKAGQDAESRATEAFAGTGLGRSGVAATAFQDLAERRASKMEDAAAGVEESRAKAQLAIAMKEAEFALSEQLGQRGWDLNNIQEAVKFQRQLWGMQFQSDLQESEEDWYDAYGDIIAGVFGVGGEYIGGKFG